MEKNLNYHVNEATNSFKRGTTDMLILAMLTTRPYYVYDLHKQLKEITNGEFDVQGPSIYTVLYRMEDRGFVTTSTEMVGRKKRVYYHIQPSGREYLRRISEAYKAINAGVMKGLEMAEEESSEALA